MDQRLAHPLHSTWVELMHRNKIGTATVCLKWEIGFYLFAHDVGPRPSEDARLTLRDPGGIYGPDNVVWIRSVPVHVTATRDDGPFWTAYCRCWWYSVEQPDQARARSAGDAHLSVFNREKVQG